MNLIIPLKKNNFLTNKFMKLKKLKSLFPVLISVIIALGLSVAVQSLLAAWTAPTAAPPSDNVAAPLNSGQSWQTKEGALWINTDGVNPYGLIVETGNVGIGTTMPEGKLSVVSDDEDGLNISVANDTDWKNPLIWGKRARGNQGNRSQVLGGDTLLEFYADGYYNGNYYNAGAIDISADGDPRLGSVPGKINFHTTPEGETLRQKRMELDSAGRLKIGEFNSSWEADLFDTGNAGDGLIISGENKDMALVSVGSSDGDKADIDFYRAVGSDVDSPGNVTATTELGGIHFHPYYNGSFSNGNYIGRTTSISASMDGTPSASSLPSKLSFSTTNSGTLNSSVKMTIKNNGNVGIGTTPNAKLDVNGLIKMWNAGAGGTCDANTLGAMFYDTDSAYGDVKVCRKNGAGGYEFRGLAWQ